MSAATRTTSSGWSASWTWSLSKNEPSPTSLRPTTASTSASIVPTVHDPCSGQSSDRPATRHRCLKRSATSYTASAPCHRAIDMLQSALLTAFPRQPPRDAPLDLSAIVSNLSTEGYLERRPRAKYFDV